MGTDTPPDWGNSSGDEAEPSYSWPWGDSGRPSDRGDSPSHLALRPSEPSGRPPPQAQQPDSLTTESVSSWFPMCSGEEYNRYRSTWQKLVQNVEPLEAERGSPLQMGDLSLCKFWFESLVPTTC